MLMKDFVYDITRVRILKDAPIVVEYMIIVEHSIYNYIEKTLKLTIQSALFNYEKMPIFELSQVIYK